MDAIRAGDFRHRVDVQTETTVIDPGTGYRTKGWAPRLAGEHAAFLPGPGREFLASEAVRASVEGRIILRYSPGTAAITNEERIILDGEAWSIKAPPLLDRTLRKTVTLMVAREVNGGA
jgi:SPP1 family predicted phage head-tail adaptor